MAKYVKTSYEGGLDITPNKEYLVFDHIDPNIGIIHGDDGDEIWVNLCGYPSTHLNLIGTWTVINR